MVELADIFRAHGQEYRAKFADRMLPSHLRAMRDIEEWRTAALGGQVYYCEECDEHLYSYHSCKNRHCPKCQQHQADQWLEKQRDILLPTHYFLVTFTLPEELRQLARSLQREVYNLLFRASAEALQQLAADSRFVGGQVGMCSVLHTWTRALIYHPHLHYIVTGGGVGEEGRWRSARENFLVPVEALSVLFRAKVRDELKKAGLADEIEERVWKKDWVVHCEPVGSGEGAFKYLAPYIFRVALSNNRILKLEEGRVTFCYKESATDQIKTCRLSAEEFIRRFLQHVLPARFVKVRYYGLMSPSNRLMLDEARQQLSSGSNQAESGKCETIVKDREASPLCPRCGKEMKLIETVKARSREPP